MMWRMIDGELGYEPSTTPLVANSFVENVFLQHMYSFSCQVHLAKVYFLPLTFALGFFCPVYVVRCKAISTATQCNIELRPLGYKIQNEFSIYLEKFSDIDCYVLRIYSI